ncbi:BQ5605_C007g04643 [Microbotryum silenes-dioicae]|uniref:BQ5605_C007g04643 protein n=1 Tax=Microbotryum silenes-dioicae TaxID=796604 RepID=A0A2X0P9N9_9BASI|nr:BQ5605_C007g04643 [Microbotryum silenes-dioicae]
MSSDPRFARLHTDPRFVRPKAAKNKIVVDKRFESVFKDEDEGSKRQRKVDKYGRKVEKDNKTLELKRYYRMEDEEDQRDKKPSFTKKDVVEEQEDGDEGDESESDEEETGVAAKPFVDLARGQVLMESSDEEGDKNDKDDEDEGDSDSDSEVGSSGDEGSVTFGGITKSGLRRRPRSPSIDLSETEHAVAGLDNEVEEGEDDDNEDDPNPTKRLAVVNMDWDNIRAVDLYRVLASPLSATAASIAETSTASGGRATAGAAKKFDERGEEVEGFKPSSRLVVAPGRLLHLRIYPSQFGRERMEREAREGPPTEVFKAAQAAASDNDEGEGELLVLGRQKNKGKTKAMKSKKRRGDNSDDESEDDVAITEQDVVRDQVEDGEEEYDHEALRKYQLERLRYYYAIATFDSATSAAHVHDQILGTEFEHTANFFDLQYVPDETSFEDDPVHDEATEATVASEGTSYTGINFVTDALRHSKVKLTWDADDPHRKTKIQSYLAAAMDPKGKGKGLANDEGVRAYLASSSDDDGEGEDAEEVDDFFEADGGDKKQGEDKRSKLRSLFGLDGQLEEQTWDGGRGTSKKGADGEMQITFASALSTKKGKKGQDDSDDEQDGRVEETAIETYKRKEKERRERKRLERKAKRDGVTLPAEGEEDPEIGGKNTGPGGFDDDFFADGGKDPFAAYDEGMESGDEIRQPKNAKGKGKDEANRKISKREKREAKQREEEEAKKSQASLELLVASDNDEDGAKHFDMRNIIKAEKTSGKRNRHKKKGKKGAAEEPQVEDSFKIDLKDDRFKSLHEDHEFAIDPTNPRFQKTRNMDALLTEGRKRRSNKLDARAPVSAPPLESVKQASKQSKESDNLQQLVESVKRKAGDVGGRGKRTKTDSA